MHVTLTQSAHEFLARVFAHFGALQCWSVTRVKWVLRGTYRGKFHDDSIGLLAELEFALVTEFFDDTPLDLFNAATRVDDVELKTEFINHAFMNGAISVTCLEILFERARAACVEVSGTIS
jgi:hypothetical protein